MTHSKGNEKQLESPFRQPADLRQLVQTYLQEYLEQSEEWLTGKQCLDMSLLDRVDQEQEAEPRLNPAECGREVAAA